MEQDNTLRMFAILRGDIYMSPGKAISQGGHLYKLLTRQVMLNNPPLAEEYFSDGGGTNVTLIAPSLEHILLLREECSKLGLPAVIFEDEDHIHPPHFTGDPIITGIGIGPIRKDQRPAKLKRLPIYK